MTLDLAPVDFKTNGNDLFTPTYFRYRKVNTRFAVVFGGASSGKSFAIHQHELIEIMKPGNGDTLVMRKTSADIRESCYKLFLQLIGKYDLGSYFRCVYGGDHKKITCLSSGRSLLFKGIDEPEKLKSIVGIKRIVMEEANQFEFEDFLELNRRARGIENIQISLILNPISENHWIKTKLCDVGGDYYSDTTLIKVTYKDNHSINGKSFLTTTDIKQLENLQKIDENHYRIYVLGEWGIENKESKFVWAFSRSQIVKTEHDPNLITWATFDFNVNPMTCIVCQILPEEETIRAIECIKLKDSDIWQMCERLTSSYPDVMWMITGDATGARRNMLARDNTNAYLIIKGQLGLNTSQIAVPSVNPRIEENRLVVNAIHKNWTVEIDPERCKDLIYDLEYVEVNGLGEIIKDRSAANKFADFLDCWRYIINNAVRQHFSFRKENEDE